MTIKITDTRVTQSWFARNGEVTTVTGSQAIVEQVWHDAGDPQIISRFIDRPVVTEVTL